MTGSYANSESGNIRSALAIFGAHRKYSENLLGGMMLQLDLASNQLEGQSGSIKSTGWMVGPYFAAQHKSHPLYFEGRLLYGQSDHDLSFTDPVLGTRTGSFDTRRMLAQLRMEGEIALSNRTGLRLIPYTDARWFRETGLAFTDNINNRVPGQTISIGQLELGMDLNVPIPTDHGAMMFTGGLGLIHSNTKGDRIVSTSRKHGRAETGISYRLNENSWIDLEGFYDGIGNSGFESYGLSLTAKMRF